MFTNFFPIKFEFENYQVTRLVGGSEKLAELRAQYNSTHSFFKKGEFIYASNKTGEDLNIGGAVTLSVMNDGDVTSSLIKHIYFKTFIESYPDYKPGGFYPFLLQSQKQENDLIRKYLPPGLQGRLSYVKEIELQIRRCIVNGSDQFGFLVNVDRSWKLDITCKELVEKNFVLEGLEVVHSVSLPGLSNILLPDESLVGTTISYNRDTALISTNDGDRQFNLNELYLRKSTRNIKKLLAFGLRSNEKAENIFGNLRKDESKILRPENIINEIKSATNILFFDKSKKAFIFENKDGFCFSIDLSSSHSYNNYQLEPPLFVFDPAKVRTNTGADYGLRSYGPYDKTQFTPKEPKVLIICHKEVRGKMGNFLKELIDGMPQSKYFTKGFKSKYELHNVVVDVREISAYDITEIQSITSKLTYEPSIVLIEMPVRLKEIRSVTESLYYQSKAHLLSLQIPVQIVTSEIIQTYDEYKLNAIGLQMYAKLGGVPWTIQTKESIDRELIIGVGNSVFRNNAFRGGDQERIVGISTFFSGDGQYMMSGNIKDVPYEQYFETLLTNLRESIQTLSKDYGWRIGDTVRLVFHIFKPIKDVEYQVVKELVKNFNEYKIQFAFVTISEFHPYVMFDEQQPGFDKFGSTIGKFVPNRGANIVLNESSCVVQMLGPSEMKTGKHGASRPILIKVLKPSSYEVEDDVKPLLFSDLHYITQQIFKFTYLSWRGFLPNQKPATMLYSSLISRLLSRLRAIPGWKSEVINFNLKYKKWFL